MKLSTNLDQYTQKRKDKNKNNLIMKETKTQKRKIKQHGKNQIRNGTSIKGIRERERKLKP
jgi:hypothetical protein